MTFRSDNSEQLLSGARLRARPPWPARADGRLRGRRPPHRGISVTGKGLTLKQIPFSSACSAFQHGRLYRPYTARTQVAAHKVVGLCTGLAVLRSSLTRFDSQAHTRCRRATLRACHENVSRHALVPTSRVRVLHEDGGDGSWRASMQASYHPVAGWPTGTLARSRPGSGERPTF